MFYLTYFFYLMMKRNDFYCKFFLRDKIFNSRSGTMSSSDSLMGEDVYEEPMDVSERHWKKCIVTHTTDDFGTFRGLLEIENINNDWILNFGRKFAQTNVFVIPTDSIELTAFEAL